MKVSVGRTLRRGVLLGVLLVLVFREAAHAEEPSTFIVVEGGWAYPLLNVAPYTPGSGYVGTTVPVRAVRRRDAGRLPALSRAGLPGSPGGDASKVEWLTVATGAWRAPRAVRGRCAAPRGPSAGRPRRRPPCVLRHALPAGGETAAAHVVGAHPARA